jgi:hypothetical protein
MLVIKIYLNRMREAYKVRVMRRRLRIKRVLRIEGIIYKLREELLIVITL